MTYQDNDERINYSANYDIPSVEIEDFVPENLIKIYPYRAVYGRANRPLIQPNAITYVRISNDSVDDFQHLKTDENGKKYIEMFYALKEDTKITNSSGIASFEDELRKVKQFSVITNDYIPQDTEKPDFFTVGKPFDADYYRAGQQSVYYANDFQPTYQAVVDDLIDDPSMSAFLMDDHSRVATATFLDTTEMTSTTSKSKIIFTEDLSLGNSPLNTEGRAGFTLNINNGALIHSIKANGVLQHTDALGNVLQNPNNDITDNALTTIGLELRNNFMTPVKMTPVNVKDKLEMFSDWHDFDVVLPLGIARQFSVDGGLSITEMQLPYIKRSTSHATSTISEIEYTDLGSLGDGTMSTGDSVSYNIYKGGTLVSGVRPATASNIGQFPSSKASGYEISIGMITKSGGYIEFPTEKCQMWAGGASTCDTRATLTFEPISGQLTYKYIDSISYSTKPLDKISIHVTTTSAYQSGQYPFNNIESLMILEDMILISAGYADNWTNMERDSDGKIKPNQRLGWMAWNISDMINRTPQDMLDSVFETYMRRFPQIFQNKDDRQLIKSLLCALSRYVYTSYSIGKGGNNFNEVYLPWYLELNGPINYWSNKTRIKVIVPGVTETENKTIHDVFMLPGVSFLASSPATKDSDFIAGYSNTDNWNKITSFSNIKFTLKTQYFREGFSSKTDYDSATHIVVPKTLRLSDLKMLSSDRKLTTTELEDTISPINKLPLPGDISTNSSDDLNYLFWTPTGDYEDIYLKTLDKQVTVKAGDTFRIQLPQKFDGKNWDVNSLKTYLKSIAPYCVIGNWNITNGLDATTVENFENNYLTTFLNNYATTIVNVNGSLSLDLDSYAYERLTGLPAVHSIDRLAVRSKVDPYSGEDGFYYSGRERWTGQWKKAYDDGDTTQNDSEAYQRFGSIAWNGSGFWGDSRNTSGTYSQLGTSTLPDDGAYGNFRHAETRIKNIIAKQLKVDISNIVLPPNGTWWTSVYGYASYVSHSATFDYQITSQNITNPITVTVTKDQNVLPFTFQNMPAIYDRNSWNNTLWNFGLIPTDNTNLPLDVQTPDEIKSINEIIITGIFIDKFQIIFNGNPTTYVLDSLTKYDESITTQRIVFY